MKTREQLRLSFLSVTIVFLILSTYYAPAWGSTSPTKAVLVRLDSTIDYKAADLVDSAVQDIEDGNASVLLIELNTATGYASPTLQIVQRIVSINSKVVVYIGPESARALGYSPYIAMAGKVLAMNEGASIGSAAAGATDPDSYNYLVQTMKQLATTNARNADAAERMVTENIAYSTDEAYAKRICDLKVESYQALLADLKIDAANVVEKTPGHSSNFSRDDAYEVLKFFADPTTIKYMFFGIAGLVFFNLALAILRPRRTRTDEGYQALLNYVRMEMEASEAPVLIPIVGVQHETPLQTQGNIPFTPTIKLNRLPMPLAGKRIETPLEVREG